MRTAIGTDHAGFELKTTPANFLRQLGDDVARAGTANAEPADYPDFAEAAGKAVLNGPADRCVPIRGSCVGTSFAAGKLHGIRAGLCHASHSAHQGVGHDDMNVLVWGSRIIGPMLAEEWVRAFAAAKFTHEERHVPRLNRIKAIEAHG
jgi:ribose 5-phosphate isomerase B